MQVRHRVMVAAQPAALAVVQTMLDGRFELVPVQSIARAMAILAHESSQIDAIVCTIAFDDSRMIDFLQAVKQNAKARAIPFICSRILASVLSDHLVDQVAAVARQCGAADFVDVAKRQSGTAPGALAAVVMNHLGKT